jgi:hypothetical protein
MFIILFLSKLIAFALITLASFVIFSISIVAYIGEMFVREKLKKCEALFRREKTSFSFLAGISMLIRAVKQARHDSCRLPCAFFLGLANKPFPKIIKQVVIHICLNWRHLKNVIPCYKDVCLIYQHLHQFMDQYAEWKKVLERRRQYQFYLNVNPSDFYSSYFRKLRYFKETFSLNPILDPILHPSWHLLDTRWERYFSAWKDLVTAWEELAVAWEERFLLFVFIPNDDSDDDDSDDDDSDDDDSDDDDINALPPLVNNTNVPARGGGLYHRCTSKPLLPSRQK